MLSIASRMGARNRSTLATTASRGAFSISWTSALPITTASDSPATARAVAASRMPKPTPTGRLHERADARDTLRDVGKVEIARPGHALQRHVVEIAAPQRRDLLQTRVRRGRREQENGVEAARVEQRRRARAPPPADSRPPARRPRPPPLAASAKRSVAHGLDRVGVAEHDHGRSGIARPELRDEPEHVLQRYAVLQRPLARALDHRTVGHRVGERHADLDHVGAALHQRVHDRHGERRLGVAGGEEGMRPCGPALQASKVAAIRDMSRVKVKGEARLGLQCDTHSRLHLTV